MLNVTRDDDLNSLVCEGIEILGMDLSKVTIKDPPSTEPLLESYEFVHYDYPPESKTTFKEAMNIICQIILQNFPGLIKKLSVSEVKSADSSNSIIKDIQAIFDGQPLVDVKYFEVEKNESKLKYNVIIASESSLPESNGTSVTDFLTEDGFIIYLGSCSKPSNLELITKFSTDTCNICLFRPPFIINERQCAILRVDSEDFTWIKELIARYNKKYYKRIFILAETAKFNGILGLINCLKCEQNDLKFVAFLLEEIPETFLTDQFYSKQIRKNLVCNILKNRSWGTYIHKPCNLVTKTSTINATLNMLNVREFATLQWLQTPLSFLR